jgi:hypothetical protein
MSDHRSPAPYSLHMDLVNLYDDFVEFHDTCSFFCDALSTMLTARTEFNQSTLEGIRDFSDYLAHKGAEMKERFRQVQRELAAGSEH